MKHTLFLIVIAVALTLLNTACKKDSDGGNTPPVDEKTVKLTASPWHKKNEGLDTDHNGSVDAPSAAFSQACYADDVQTFVANGDLNWSEGASKCNAADPQSYKLSWHFTAKGIFLLDHDNTIFTLTDNAFKFITK